MKHAKLFVTLVSLLNSHHSLSMSLTEQVLAAAEGDNIEQIVSLLSSGADKDSTNELQQTPLHLAAKHNCKSTVEFLLDNNANIDAQDWQGFTPLMQAIIHHHTEIVSVLLAHDANVHIKDTVRGYTPLHWAVEKENQVHWAVEKENQAIIRLLYGYQANVNSVDNQGKTPLHLAVKHSNNYEIAELLLTLGADKKIRDNDGHIPLYYAFKHNNKAIINLLLNKQYC